MSGTFVTERGYPCLVWVDERSQKGPGGFSPSVELLLSASWGTGLVPRLNGGSYRSLTREVALLGLQLRAVPGGFQAVGDHACLSGAGASVGTSSLETAFHAMEFLAHRLRGATVHPVFPSAKHRSPVFVPEGGPVFGPPRDLGVPLVTKPWHPRLRSVK